MPQPDSLSPDPAPDPAPRKKRHIGWLHRQFAWFMAVMGASTGYKPWEGDPDEDEDETEESKEDKP